MVNPRDVEKSYLKIIPGSRAATWSPGVSHDPKPTRRTGPPCPVPSIIVASTILTPWVTRLGCSFLEPTAGKAEKLEFSLEGEKVLNFSYLFILSFACKALSENELRLNSKGILMAIIWGIPHFQTHQRILRKVAAGFCCTQQLFFHATGLLGSTHRSRWA